MAAVSFVILQILCPMDQAASDIEEHSLANVFEHHVSYTGKLTIYLLCNTLTKTDIFMKPEGL